MKIFAFILISLILCNSALAETDDETDYSSSKLSDNGHFKVSYTSKQNPIEINNLHAWFILIKDANGENVLDAEIEAVGGMPEHNHGLPTQPQVTKDLGEGCYLLEGMKFHMLGWWTVTISIKHKDLSDVVTFNLKL